MIPQGTQAQAIAYSTDEGLTWTPYEKNPVINPNKDPSLNPREFRDPKVFWYKPSKQWIMAIALSAQHMVRFYSSTDLKNWTKLSDFGPANAVGGVWEVPDLFELPVDTTPRDKTRKSSRRRDKNASKKPGNDEKKPRNSKWVLVVNLNPGSVAVARALSISSAISTASSSRPRTSSIPPRRRREWFSRISKAVTLLRTWVGPLLGISLAKGPWRELAGSGPGDGLPRKQAVEHFL